VNTRTILTQRRRGAEDPGGEEPSPNAGGWPAESSGYHRLKRTTSGDLIRRKKAFSLCAFAPLRETPALLPLTLPNLPDLSHSPHNRNGQLRQARQEGRGEQAEKACCRVLNFDFRAKARQGFCANVDRRSTVGHQRRSQTPRTVAGKMHRFNRSAKVHGHAIATVMAGSNPARSVQFSVRRETDGLVPTGREVMPPGPTPRESLRAIRFAASQNQRYTQQKGG